MPLCVFMGGCVCGWMSGWVTAIFPLKAKKYSFVQIVQIRGRPSRPSIRYFTLVSPGLRRPPLPELKQSLPSSGEVTNKLRNNCIHHTRLCGLDRDEFVVSYL